ncbi:MAG: TetR family transcriptional regulator [Clostridia bacterium]|nr:TetR family transcriptional regulator [Clostridia bacterium]
MPSPTKQAIIASFIKLASRKPLEKITVRDLVDDCGINRNTFYYHFQDIFAVLEEICRLATAQVDTSLPFGEMLGNFFFIFANYTEQYPRAVSHFAASVGQSGAERYFAAELDELIFTAIKQHKPDSTPELQRTATVFLRHALIGLCLDFVNHHGRIDKDALAARIATLAKGVLSSL